MTDTYKSLRQQVTDRGPWSQTATGRAFYLADPKVEEVHFEDIAIALSRQTRYNGHLKSDVVGIYSVAQHATLISQWMERDGHDPFACYAALHHDSAEAYTGDIVTQLKYCIPGIRPFLKRVEDVVEEALGISWMTSSLRHTIKFYDIIALSTERRDLLSENHTDETWDLDEFPPRDDRIVNRDQYSAMMEFVDRHYQLKNYMEAYEKFRRATVEQTAVW